MAWDGKLVNNNVYAKGQTLNIRSLPLVSSKAIKTIKAGTRAGRTTGATSKQTDGIWYQLLLDPDYKTYGYVRSDVVILKPASKDISEKDAKSVVDELVKNDIAINNGLIRIAVYLANLAKKGKNVASWQKTFDTVQQRWINRQNKIKQSKLLQYKTGFQKGYESLLSETVTYLKNLKKENMVLGIGAVPIAAAVIYAIIGAGLAAAAYFSFRPDYEDSVRDLKITSDLESALSKVDPETAQKIKDQLEEQIDDAYQAGKEKQQMKDWGNIGKYILIFGLGFFAFSQIGKLNRSKNEK